MTRQMTIGKKLIASFGVVLATAVALSLGAFWQVRSLTSDLNNAVHVTARRQYLAGQIEDAVAQMTVSEQTLLLGAILQRPAGMTKGKDLFRKELAAVQAVMNEYQTLAEAGENNDALNALRQGLDQVVKAHDDMVGALDRNQLDVMQKLFDEQVMPREDETDVEASALASQEVERLSAFAKSAESAASRGQWMIALLFLTSLAAGGVVLWVIRQTNRDLRGMAAEVAGGSLRVGRAAAQVSTASQSLAQYASEQAAALQETSASMQEMRAVTHKNNDNSSNTASLMNASMQKVAAAEMTIREMSVSMHEISLSGEKITKVVKLIDDIAFQTKILSLNAAVEAARAGAAGAGFAVVAEQVGHLAQECAEAARSTAEMIDGTVAGVRDGSLKLVKAAEAIQEVVKHSGQVKALVDEVHTGSQEQARGIDQVARAVSQMQEVTQKTASNAEEGAASGRELDQHAERLNKLVERMHDLVGGSEADGLAGTDGDDLAAFRPSLHRPAQALASASLPNLGRAVGTRSWEMGAPNGNGSSHEAELPLDSEFKEF